VNYEQFLKRKERDHKLSGFEAGNLNDLLKPFQSFSVKLSLEKGRFALFEDCGLGKTFQALEWSKQVNKYTGKPVLNLAPLAVVEQTINEGEKFGIAVSEVGAGSIQITNYEQLENIDTSIYAGIVIDESSILKNFEGAYRNLIIDRFRHTPYKLACTATPSPNDPMELGNHAEFLGVMNRSEMLATYFVHDGGETAKWRLKGHAVDKFWKWVNSWSLMFSKPSDIGFDDEGYILPPLNFIEKQIETPHRGMQLFNDVAVSATNFNQELRLTKLERLSEVVSIVNNSKENFIIWIKQNEEADYLKKLIPDAVEVRGDDTPEYKKEKLIGFGKNQFRVLITKTKIGAMGLNYQNCHNQIFASLDFSFESLYQGIRRSYRFGQSHMVNIYMITTDTMQNVIQSIKNKEAQYLEMQSQMIKYTKELYGKYRKAA
jgi:hypothetical protein